MQNVKIINMPIFFQLGFYFKLSVKLIKINFCEKFDEKYLK